MTPWDEAYLRRRQPRPDTEPAERETQDAFLYIVAAFALIVIMFGG